MRFKNKKINYPLTTLVIGIMFIVFGLFSENNPFRSSDNTFTTTYQPYFVICGILLIIISYIVYLVQYKFGVSNLKDNPKKLKAKKSEMKTVNRTAATILIIVITGIIFSAWEFAHNFKW